MNLEETKAIFRIFEQSFPDFIASEEKARIWAAVLADLSFEKAKIGAFEICRKDTRQPVPARLLSAVKKATELQDTDEPAEAIWERLMKLAQRGDAGQSEFETKESPRTQKAVGSVGGFSYLRYADLSTMPFVRRDFVAAYKEFKNYESLQIENHQIRELVRNLANQKLLK